MESMGPVGESSFMDKELTRLYDQEKANVQERGWNEGWDLPVLIFWGLMVTSLILSTWLAIEVWAF